MRAKSLSKTTLKFENMSSKWFKNCLPFKYFRDNWQNTYWSIIILKVFRTLFESRYYIGKFERFRVFWWTNTFIELKSYYLFSINVCIFKTLTGISVSCTALLALSPFISLSTVYLSTFEKSKTLNYIAKSGE